MKILIVDDEFFNRRLLRHSLEKFAICTDVANGRDAIDAFEDAIQKGERFDLVMMDIMMPRMDGHQALEHIRKIESDSQIDQQDQVKVIMVTTLGDQENVILAGQNSADGYILKPYESTTLYESIRQCGLNLESK